jgi:hypothetical protein
MGTSQLCLGSVCAVHVCICVRRARDGRGVFGMSFVFGFISLVDDREIKSGEFFFLIFFYKLHFEFLA